MAMKCTNCKKGILYGHNVSHSKRRTRKVFKPNLHVARIAVNGISTKMKLCTKCLRTLKKEKTLDTVSPSVVQPASATV